jgi:glutaredoxin
MSGLMYICPTGTCDSQEIDDWSSGIGVDVTKYEANWASQSIGLLTEPGEVYIVDVSSKANYYKTMCDEATVEKACEHSSAAEQDAAQAACDSMQKVANTELEAYVVSYCPYGLQMQRVLNEVQKTLGSGNIKVRYIGAVVDGVITSMHGEQEAVENHRQICIREEQNDKYWDYVGCFIKAGDSETCLAEAKIDTTMLSECMEDPERGVKYAEEDFAGQAKYGVTGSPTLILNGQRVSEFNFGGRSAEAVKTMLCCSMSKEVSGCSRDLQTEQASVAFSATYSEGGAATSGAATC